MKNPESAPRHESSPNSGHEDEDLLPALERDPENLSTSWIARPASKSGENDTREPKTFDSQSEAIDYLYAKPTENKVPQLEQLEDQIDLSPKNALDHDLYRVNKAGKFIRPAASSGAFVDAAPDSVATDHRLSEYRYISTGKTERGNEKAIIDEFAGAIIASYEARDNALASGMSVTQAQEVGANAFANYQLAEQRRSAAESNTSDNAPSDPEAPAPTEAPQELAPGTTEAITEPTSPETKEATEAIERIEGFIKRSGHAALLGIAILKETGADALIVYGVNRATDYIRPAASKAMKDIDQAADRFIQSTRNGARRGIDSVSELSEKRLKEIRDFITERKKRTTEQKAARTTDRRAKAESIAADIRAYLASKRAATDTPETV